MERIIITVVGKDQVGIIGKICTHLSDSGINILDISQTIVSGFFNMMVIADLSTGQVPFSQIAGELKTLGDSMGLIVQTQREAIFTAMHRI